MTHYDHDVRVRFLPTVLEPKSARHTRRILQEPTYLATRRGDCKLHFLEANGA